MVGASVSAADIAVDLTQTAELPVHAVMVGRNANVSSLGVTVYPLYRVLDEHFFVYRGLKFLKRGGEL